MDNTVVEMFFSSGKKRNYRARYEIEVKNNLEKENQIFLVAPLPAKASQQELKSEIIFKPSDCEIKTDPVFGNQYVIWLLTLKPRETTRCCFLFKIAVLPLKVKPLRNFQLNDYGQPGETDRALFIPNRFVQFENEQIRTLSGQIIGQEKNLQKIIKRLNNFVVFQLDYGRPIEGLYSALEAWENKITDCGGFSTLLVALCLAVGIPARLAIGFWAGPPSSALGGLRRAQYDKNEMHAWVEILLPNGQWMSADPAVEKLKQQGRTKKKARPGFIGSDRIVFSHGCDIPLEINGQEKRVDILQNPLVFSENGLGSCSAKIKFLTL